MADTTDVNLRAVEVVKPSEVTPIVPPQTPPAESVKSALPWVIAILSCVCALVLALVLVLERTDGTPLPTETSEGIDIDSDLPAYPPPPPTHPQTKFDGATSDTDLDLTEYDGKGHYIWDGSQYGWGNITVYYYVPPKVDYSRPPLGVFCGWYRQAAHERSAWEHHANRHKFIVFSPFYPWDEFPSMLTGLGDSSWMSTYELIWQDLKARMHIKSLTYNLWGHSLGANLVTKYMMLYPDASVNVYVAGNGGWFTFPDYTIPYPYGLKGTRLEKVKGKEEKYAWLDKKLLMFVAELDTICTHIDDKCSVKPQAMEQGPFRRARGENYYYRNKCLAKAEGFDFKWKMYHIPDAIHEGYIVIPLASRALGMLMEGSTWDDDLDTWESAPEGRKIHVSWPVITHCDIHTNETGGPGAPSLGIHDYTPPPPPPPTS